MHIVGAVIIVLLILLFLIVIIWSISQTKAAKVKKVLSYKGKLNQYCLNNDQCLPGLNCDNYICKSAVGGYCANLSDCTAEATACTKYNTCTNAPLPQAGQNCFNLPCAAGNTCQNDICRVDLGGSCTNDNQCVSSSVGCYNGKCQEFLPTVNMFCLSDSGEKGTGACQNPYVCDSTSDLCKVPRGGLCNPDKAECISGTVCAANGDTYLCSNIDTSLRVCSNDSECRSGQCGGSNLLIYQPVNEMLIPIQNFENDQVIDTVAFNQYLLVLLENGHIIKEALDASTTVINNIKLERIITFAENNLYGLSQGQLYQLISNVNSNDWIWKLLKWAPKNITHISSTYDGLNLWLQYKGIRTTNYKEPEQCYPVKKCKNDKNEKDKCKKEKNKCYPVIPIVRKATTGQYIPDDVGFSINSSNNSSNNSTNNSTNNSSNNVASDNIDSLYDDILSSRTDNSRNELYPLIYDNTNNNMLSDRGTLYQYNNTNNPNNPKILSEIIMKDGIFRSYGLNKYNYLDINKLLNQATVISQNINSGQVIENFHVGVLLRSGEVFKIGMELAQYIRNAFYTRGLAHVITNRICKLTVEAYNQLQLSGINFNEDNYLSDLIKFEKINF